MTQSTGTLPTFGTSRSKAFMAIICDMVRCRSSLSILPTPRVRKCGKGSPPISRNVLPYVLAHVPRFAAAQTFPCRRKHEASAHYVKRGPLHGTRRVGVQGGRACCHRQCTRLFPLSRSAFAFREHVFGPVETGQGDASGAMRRGEDHAARVSPHAPEWSL